MSIQKVGRSHKSDVVKILSELLGFRQLDLEILLLLYEKCGGDCPCLTAREISRMLGKSRTSVRNGLRKLVAMGLVRCGRAIHASTDRFVYCYSPAMTCQELYEKLREKLYDMFRNLENQLLALLRCRGAHVI